MYGQLKKAGRDYGVLDVGYYALRMLRIEKFVPFWAEELDSSVTPLEANRSARVKLQVSDSGRCLSTLINPPHLDKNSCPSAFCLDV